MCGLAERRTYSSGKINQLRDELKEAASIAAGKACVYATGSLGRGEASEHSDLDVFIAGKSKRNSDGELLEDNELNHLSEICIQAELIKASRRLNYKEFSRDGRYLDHHSVFEFVNALGTEKDDVTNTFTARLLLLLESQVLIEPDVYDEVVREVISGYWRDYEDHRSDFMPAFFANDVLRLWRTFCVNYEANTERQPDDKKAKGKLVNYKLRHSRLLTCYSALLYLLAIYRANGTVSPIDAFEMTKLTPTSRLEWLRERSDLSECASTIGDLLEQYDRFLRATSSEEPVLVERFKDREAKRKYFIDAHQFGDTMYKAISLVGGDNRFCRLLVV